MNIDEFNESIYPATLRYKRFVISKTKGTLDKKIGINYHLDNGVLIFVPIDGENYHRSVVVSSKPLRGLFVNKKKLFEDFLSGCLCVSLALYKDENIVPEIVWSINTESIYDQNDAHVFTFHTKNNYLAFFTTRTDMFS